MKADVLKTHPKFLLLVLMVAVNSSLWTGCMTIITLSSHNDMASNREAPLVLSGTRECMKYFEAKENDPNNVDPHGYIWLFACGPPFPFNFVADIVVLPVTIPWALYEESNAKERKRDQKQERM